MTPETAFALLEPITLGLPFNAVLGVGLTEVSSEGVVIGLPNRPELANNPVTGTLHGGVISSVLDLVGGMSALAAMVFEEDLGGFEEVIQRFSKFGTVDLRVDYLRPGRGESFLGNGTVMRAGRRIAVTRMEFVNEQGTLLATGTGTYVTG